MMTRIDDVGAWFMKTEYLFVKKCEETDDDNSNELIFYLR